MLALMMIHSLFSILPSQERTIQTIRKSIMNNKKYIKENSWN